MQIAPHNVVQDTDHFAYLQKAGEIKAQALSQRILINI